MEEHTQSQKQSQKQLGYIEALKKVFEIRIERKKIYGDSWKDSPDWELLAQIKNKYGRLESFISRVEHRNKNYENEIDCLIDLINYSVFLLQNKLKEKEK